MSLFALFFHRGQFDVARKLRDGIGDQGNRFGVVVNRRRLIDLRDPVSFGICSGLLLPALLEALDLNIDAGRLRMNVAERFPLPKRVRKLPGFLEGSGLAYDRLH